MEDDDVYLEEVLFEFQKVGRVIRVSAIDPLTNTEVSSPAPPGYGEELMKRLALRKLKYVLRKKRELKSDEKMPPERGIIV